MTPTTGIELELLLPPGMQRADLLAQLASRYDGRVELFEAPSKVPVPHLAGAELEGEAAVQAVMAAMQDVASHHQARLHSISQDGRYFYLSHRVGRVVDNGGRTLISVVHDNTIAGGERVAELVTPPLGADRDGWVRGLLSWLGSLPGLSLPARAALHVHVDDAHLRGVEPLTRLVRVYQRFEPELRRWLRSPDNLHAGRPLSAGLLTALKRERGVGWGEARPRLAEQVRDKRGGLNLYNVLHVVEATPTVELKLAAASLDPDWVLAVRALFLRLTLLAAGVETPLPQDLAGLREAVDPDGELFPILVPDGRL